jgi:hypothetical protein
VIREERDPGYWARIANDGAVRPTLGGEGPLDFTEIIQRPDVVALAAPHGGFVFLNIWPTRWELHTMFLPEGRGRNVLRSFGAAAQHMFTATDCAEIVTKAADSNRAAQFMALKAGFRVVFRREGAWQDGSGLNHYALTLDEWTARSGGALEAGRRFHDMLTDAKAKDGSALPVHADDDAHDRAAGAAVLMFEAGQAVKAVWSYNRWAAFAGYRDIELASEAPPAIDARDALIGLRDGKVEVLECR